MHDASTTEKGELGTTSSDGGLKEMKGDRELCTAAVTQNWQAFKCATEKMKGDRELCMAAVAQDWRALEFVSQEMKGDREFFTAVVAQEWRALAHSFGPKHMQHEQDIEIMVLVVMRKDVMSLEERFGGSMKGLCPTRRPTSKREQQI